MQSYTVVVENKIVSAVEIVKKIVTKYKLGKCSFERAEGEDKAGMYCFQAAFRLDGKQFDFAIGIDTFGQMYMASCIGGWHRVPLTFNTMDEEVVFRLLQAGLIKV